MHYQTQQSDAAGKGEEFAVAYNPPTVLGTFKAFASIMFAFAGASTFPTIQADMKERDKFTISAVIACTILFLIYVPMAVAGYFAYGSAAKSYIVDMLPNGPIRMIIEIMLLLHLISAFPIITNPPAQYFEQLFNIPSDFNLKRCLFRTFSVLVLLFIAETVPSFGSILDLVGASTVTLLTFVFPPFFYMKLCDQESSDHHWSKKELPLWERIYCWLLIVLGLVGGISATYTAVLNLVSANMSTPCYLQMLVANATEIEVSGGH